MVTKAGLSIGKASKKLNIKYSTARDIMSWWRKHGRPYRSAWDQFRSERGGLDDDVPFESVTNNTVSPETPKKLIVSIEMSDTQKQEKCGKQMSLACPLSSVYPVYNM